MNLYCRRTGNEALGEINAGKDLVKQRKHSESLSCFLRGWLFICENGFQLVMYVEHYAYLTQTSW
ncbi:hypothetical protein DFO73_11619 [Cytobacillus oceanisediminis]|uniref:Uncharacterized protein n=1 Tax=Cytobacillus oceanisediminis TaxID=665099 RepID=A0A2V2ZJT2_9BACI|nr:hypothetical protein DFO73_11619 [Cytobacillus oceanisediminis]